MSAYEPWGPRSIFRIRFELPPVFKLKQSPGQMTSVVAEMTTGVLNYCAEIVMKKLHYALSRGGKFKVGATETAARNFVVQMVSTGTANQAIEIQEGTLTKANFFIRRGSTGRGNPPPEENIRSWLIAKRIPLYLHDVWKQHRELGFENVKLPRRRPWSREQVRYTKRGYKYRPVRPWKNSQSLFDEILDRIVWSIAFNGTSQFSLGRPPIGRRYFDYLWWVAEQEWDYVKAMRQGADEITRAIVNFAFSGGKETGLDPFMIRSRVRTYKRW
jgi:hypothetical protein